MLSGCMNYKVTVVLKLTGSGCGNGAKGANYGNKPGSAKIITMWQGLLSLNVVVTAVINQQQQLSAFDN